RAGAGTDEPFPSREWWRGLAAGNAANPDRRRDLDALARAYWQPIAAFLQRGFRLDAAAAADHTQDFFVHLLEGQALDRADPQRGRFRAYLKAALRRFAVDRHRRERAQKRGGGARPLPPDGAAGLVGGDDRGPEQALDEAWRQTLLERALALLERETAAAGQPVVWRVFHDYFVADEQQLDYAAVAARHGISTVAVGNHLMAGKRRFRALLR